MEQSRPTLRHDLVWALLLGGWAGLAALSPRRTGALWLSLPLVLIPLAWWMVSGASRWVLAFLAAAFLLPPLPLPWGDAGPHPALLPAALGLWAGVARLPAWRIRRNFLSASLVVFLLALLLSVPAAVLYSSPAVALGSLARVGLFAVSVYLFFYLADGPGRELAPERLVRLLFWAGTVSAAFACLDFYFQFPALARFAEQFVWLPGGVFRRAQGVFYEASTLGSFCVFLLVMMASIAVLQLGGRLRLSPALLLPAAIVCFVALILSFSRAAMISLVVALLALLWLERKRLQLTVKLAHWGAAALGCLASAAALLYSFFPDLFFAYLVRFRASGEYLFTAPNLMLSRRLDTWYFLLAYLREHPWRTLFGIGYKTLPYSSSVGRPVVADNMYLSLLIETGWPGLAALLLLNAAVLVTSYRAALASKPESRHADLRRLCGVWMFCFWCGEMVQMLSGDVLTYWRILPAFFAVLAVSARQAIAGSRDEHSLP